jgi:hypothetical protein
LCPLTLEFDVFWYETLIREKSELMGGFIDPSASVRLTLVDTQIQPLIDTAKPAIN